MILDEGEQSIFLAGDTSYSEQLMLEGAIDGVAPDAGRARETVERIQELARSRPLVYLPTHDPGSGDRLAARQNTQVADRSRRG